MTDDVLEQADQLMRRHRSFVAEGAGSPPPPAPQAPAEDEDIPLLTEVVSLEKQALGAAPAETALPAVAPAAPTEAAPVDTSALASELEAWLDLELPGHVMHAMDGITDQVILQVALRARSELLPRLLAALEKREDAGNPAGQA